jgi:hypothetical protein
MTNIEKYENLESKLTNNFKYLTDEQWDWIRLQIINHKLPVEVYNMNITLINRTPYLIISEAYCRRPKGWQQRIHTFAMIKNAGDLYDIEKIS